MNLRYKDISGLKTYPLDQLQWLRVIIGLLSFFVLHYYGSHIFEVPSQYGLLGVIGTGTTWLYSFIVVLIPMWISFIEVCVCPGKKIPVDGEVIEGDSSQLDESMLTGDPLLAVKSKDDEVIAGTINNDCSDSNCSGVV